MCERLASRGPAHFRGTRTLSEDPMGSMGGAHAKRPRERVRVPLLASVSVNCSREKRKLLFHVHARREPEQTASAAEGTTLGRGTRRVATSSSTDYGGPVARRRRAEDGEAEQTRRARRGREQDVAEISRRMYDEIRT